MPTRVHKACVLSRLFFAVKGHRSDQAGGTCGHQVTCCHHEWRLSVLIFYVRVFAAVGPIGAMSTYCELTTIKSPLRSACCEERQISFDDFYSCFLTTNSFSSLFLSDYFLRLLDAYVCDSSTGRSLRSS